MRKENERTEKQNQWLNLVSEHSWEPELLISGLAIYATLQMPGIFKQAYNYYLYNLQTSTNLADDMLPLLIFSIFTTISYLLFAGFVIHFIVRAFWVGFIGLRSAFPKAIKYDQLEYSNYYIDQMKEKMGSADDLAIRLDKISSIVYSMAFTLVLMFIGVAFLYFVFFLLVNGLKLILPADIYATYSAILLIILLVGLLFIAVVSMVLNLRTFRNHPRYSKWYFKLNWGLLVAMFPLVNRPFQFNVLTFMSNVPKKKFYSAFTTIFIGFFCVLFVVMMDIESKQLFDVRDFGASKSSEKVLTGRYYDDNIPDDIFVWKPTIPSAMVTSSPLPVFLPYPKLLDSRLQSLCTIEVDDSLNKYERRRRLNQQRLTCVDSLFTVTVDDSVFAETDLMFAEHPVTKQAGFRMFLPIAYLLEGKEEGDTKHLLKIEQRAITEDDKERREQNRPLKFEATIPFWIQ